MNRANQQALYQATNQGLLGIRQSEINYYQSLNVAFGTQAALIGGFTYGVFTQNQVNENPEFESIDMLADVYWICSAITIALAVHVILCTMLMQVLGPGLALNGPVGSMARATEGMRMEQRQIIISFIMMMVMFSLATVLSCWVVMSLEASIGCSIAFAIAASYWYKYCERIYLRFYWDPEESGWNAKSGSMDDLDEPEPTANVDTVRNPLAKMGQGSSSAKQRGRVAGKRKGLFSFMFRPKSSSKGNERQKSADSDGSNAPQVNIQHVDSLPVGFGLPVPSAAQGAHPLRRTLTSSSYTSEAGPYGISSNPTWAATSASRGIVMEGYLTKRGGSTQKFIDFRNEPWERRYFTLTNTSNLFIYKNRHDYRTDPKSPIYTRPLRLQEYYIEVNNFDFETRETIGNEMSDQLSVSSEIPQLATHKSLFAVNNLTVPDDSTIKPHRFQMTLVLRENVDAVDGNMSLVVSGSGTSAGAGAQSTAAVSRQLRYRDHWVLRCDTEEELQQWVAVMIDLCPSCFKHL